jgi:hypothetical protein
MRLLVLGTLAVGIALVLAAGPSGAARGTHAQTGYGTDTVPPREIATNANTSSGHTGGGGSNTGVVLGIVGGIILIGGGAAAYFIRRDGGAPAAGS